MRIVLDAGHGGHDSGAVSEGVCEKDLNLIICTIMSGILLSIGHEVVLTRKDDTFLSLQERCDKASEDLGDVFISVHCNASPNKDVKGLEIFHYPSSLTGLNLAKKFHKVLTALDYTIDRGIKTSNFYVLKHTKMPAILIEFGFMTNHEDLEVLKRLSL